ncbi:MAG: glycoside hydrolase family 18 protein [Ginsengibacter sp.]
MKPILVILVFLLFLSSCKKENTQPDTTPPPVNITPPPAFGFYVVGYFPSYRSVADVPDVQFKRCNVVNYAFFEVSSSGLLTVEAPDVLAALMAKARANDAKIFVSINGAANFKNMAATENGRNNFIKDVMQKVRQYGFDGVDVDWEFPRTDDGTDVTYTALMKELSDSLHRDAKYYLTTAITAGKYAGAVRDAIRTELFAYVDWFNIMSYDDFSTTVPYKNHSTLLLAETSLNYWIDVRKMPPAKAVLGIPAYGRPSGITQTGTILTYKGILADGGSPLSDSAVVSNGSFSNYTIYYNGQPTVKKKAIMAKQRANGIMLWELAQDSPDQNSLLKAACDTVGIIY